MRRLLWMCVGVGAAVVVHSAPLELVTCERALEFGGEDRPAGTVSTALVAAPDAPPGTHTLEAQFRLTKHQQGDWLDAQLRPSAPIDCSGSKATRVWIRAGQPTDYLVLKLVDPDAPGGNHAAFEGALLVDGAPLPADKWVAVDVPLPEQKTRRDGISYVSFYIATSNEAVPLGQDLVFQIGRFPFVPPKRVPWPPRGIDAPVASARVVWEGPLAPSGPWHLVDGKDNQTDHRARFVAGGVEFLADASGWNEFLWSRPEALHLKPKTTYRLQFDYVVLAPPGGGDGATFYSLIRAKGTIREDVGWQRWGGGAGTRGRRLVTFTTNDVPRYHLTLGIRHHGGLRIENIRLLEALTAEGGGR
ncbi:MAG: hypothetical protein HN742_33390 [Lentisphaerae bacterium]|nr:hypothetical protein [Lentisphaerota bacterium]MBT4814778.1 hypothetical protein [Lentisphaerota bacterium]MBT5611305.1 hypothetical protein [Lentisphaerota bacterium]MBT7054786.1 hypothetical protein [Lentisphaerota bacterium]MBT7846813.1 hypothetical protein [Lentisphaerota bacterium]